MSSTATRLCRDPAFALMPSNALLCADADGAAHPVEVASALTCRTGQRTATLHATITNPNQDRSARFTFSAPGPLAGPTGAAARGQIDPGGAVRLRLRLPRSTTPAALYLETAVEVWAEGGARWVDGPQRLWTTEPCERGSPEARTAQARLLCAPAGRANVVLTPQPLAYRDDHQPVVVSWSRRMRVTTDASARHPRSTAVTIDLAERFLTVVRVAPKAATDVLVVRGWGARTIQHDGAAPSRMAVVPVGRCLSSG